MAQWLREMSAGEWFESDTGAFEIVGLDVDHELVLVQHFDGTLAAFDFDSWLELAAVPCAPPEDYDGLVSDTTVSTTLDEALQRLS